MKVQIINIFTWQPHLDQSIEVAIGHVKEGHEVHYYFGLVENFEETNLARSFVRQKITWLLLRSKALLRVKKYSKIYGFKFSPFFVGSQGVRDFGARVSLDDLENLKFDGQSLGLGVRGSLNNALTDGRINSSDIPQLIPKLLKRACRIYRKVKVIINRENPDVIVQFNPRFSGTMSIYFASKEHTAQLWYYERAATDDKYALFKGSIFDGSTRHLEIEKHWRESDEGERDRVGRSFFEQPITRPKISGNLVNESVDRYLSDKEKNIFFFPSSIHETFSLGDLYRHYIFKSQLDSIEQLSKMSRQSNSFNFVVREHPILSKKSDEERAFWRSFFSHNDIKYIAHDSPICTYDLMKKADGVVVYHSTVAIEAAFRLVPAMALGSPWYIGLNAVFMPKDLNDIKRFLTDPESIKHELNFANSIKYGYYAKTFGTPYKYVNR